MTTLDLYKDLPRSQNRRLKFGTDAPFTPTYVTSHLQTPRPSETYIERVKGRQILLENPARESRLKKARDEKKARRRAEREKRNVGRISRREAAEKGLWRLDESQAKFELFLPMHHLWMGYMSELLNLPQPPLLSTDASTSPPPQPPASSIVHPKLVKADFHGALITVSQSKNPCLVGLSGIVIIETENAFKLITPQNKVKLVPKANSIFSFATPLYSTLPPSHVTGAPLPIPQRADATTTVLQGPHMAFELHGNQFRFRSSERAARKFKHKETIVL